MTTITHSAYFTLIGDPGQTSLSSYLMNFRLDQVANREQTSL